MLDKPSNAVPTALTIAGSDSGGGAGIQADLKSFSALGVYGASVITAVTAQNTQEVTAVHGIPDNVIAAQINAVLDDIRIDAVKIGMLATSSIIHTVSKELKSHFMPIILDPVMIAKSGDTLLEEEAICVLPGSSFGEGGRGHIRMSYSGRDEKDIKATLEKMERFHKKYRS